MFGKGRLFYQLMGLMLSIVALSVLLCSLLGTQVFRFTDEMVLSTFKNIAADSAAYPVMFHDQWLATAKRVLNEEHLLSRLCAMEDCTGEEAEVLELLDRLENRLVYKESYTDYSFIYLRKSGLLLGSGAVGEAARAILETELDVDDELYSQILSQKAMDNRILHTDSGFHGFLAVHPLNSESFLIHAYQASSREDLIGVKNFRNAEAHYFDRYGASLSLQPDSRLDTLYDFRQLEAEDNFFSTVVDGERYFITWTTLDESGMKFAIYTPDESYSSQIALKRLLFLIPILLLLLGIALAYFSARHFYRPIERLMARIPKEEQKPGVNEMALLETTMTALELRYREYEAKLRSIEEVPNNEDARFAGICSFIQEHYTDPNLSATMVAEAFGISTSALTRLFKKRCDMGYLDYVQLLRIEAARKLLLTTELSVSAVSEAVGYANPMTMTRAFKRYLDITPAALRN